MFGLAEAIEAGLGIGYAPCFIADPRPALVRLARRSPPNAADLWLLTHPDLRHAARVRVFLDFMAAEIASTGLFWRHGGRERRRFGTGSGVGGRRTPLEHGARPCPLPIPPPQAREGTAFGGGEAALHSVNETPGPRPP